MKFWNLCFTIIELRTFLDSKTNFFYTSFVIHGRSIKILISLSLIVRSSRNETFQYFRNFTFDFEKRRAYSSIFMMFSEIRMLPVLR